MRYSAKMIFTSIIVAVLSGCGGGEEKSKQESEASEQKQIVGGKSQDVEVSVKYRPQKSADEKKAGENTTGAGDVVDYFTGSKPLEIKKNKEIELEKIRKKHEKELQQEINSNDN